MVEETPITLRETCPSATVHHKRHTECPKSLAFPPVPTGIMLYITSQPLPLTRFPILTTQRISNRIAVQIQHAFHKQFATKNSINKAVTQHTTCQHPASQENCVKHNQMNVTFLRHTGKCTGCKSMYATFCQELSLRQTFIELRSNGAPRSCSKHGRRWLSRVASNQEMWASRKPIIKRPEILAPSEVWVNNFTQTFLHYQHFGSPPRNNRCEPCVIHKPKQHWYRSVFNDTNLFLQNRQLSISPSRFGIHHTYQIRSDY